VAALGVPDSRIGTMLIWVPLVLYTFAIGNTWQATGLLIYCIVVVGQIDYISRVTLLRRIGDVHPVTTILGVIVGLGLFGFMGLIFGPLLISYLVLLFKIYMNEFIEDPVVETLINKPDEVKMDPGEINKKTP
jgi:predicted PurR-regulated permease PerM